MNKKLFYGVLGLELIGCLIYSAFIIWGDTIALESKDSLINMVYKGGIPKFLVIVALIIAPLLVLVFVLHKKAWLYSDLCLVAIALIGGLLYINITKYAQPSGPITMGSQVIDIHQKVYPLYGLWHASLVFYMIHRFFLSSRRGGFDRTRQGLLWIIQIGLVVFVYNWITGCAMNFSYIGYSLSNSTFVWANPYGIPHWFIYTSSLSLRLVYGAIILGLFAFAFSVHRLAEKKVSLGDFIDSKLIKKLVVLFSLSVAAGVFNILLSALVGQMTNYYTMNTTFILALIIVVCYLFKLVNGRGMAIKTENDLII